MDTEDAFLDAIGREPDVDVHRLVYADWLDENGDAVRAQFIRVECALARLAPEDARRAALEEERGALLTHLEHRWSAGAFPPEVRTDRGMITEVALPPVLFVDGWDQGFLREPLLELQLLVPPDRPIQEVEIRDVVGRVGDSPLRDRLRGLHVRFYPLTAAHLKRLLGGPVPAHLTSLRLEGAGLRYGLECLARLPVAGQLVLLDLSANRLGAGGTADLLDHADAFPRLRYLGLAGHSAWFDDVGGFAFPNVEDEGVALLASSPFARQLESLEVQWNYLGPDTPGVRALLSSPFVSGLRWLRAGELEDERTEAVLRARFGDRLRWEAGE